jgi:hypothetical protein
VRVCEGGWYGSPECPLAHHGNGIFAIIKMVGCEWMGLLAACKHQ